MIFVTVGSSTIPFDRLLAAVDGLDAKDHVVVQHGASAIRPRAAECVDFIEYDRLVAYVREARVVVTHGGVGSIMTALDAGKRPLVVPRRQRHGEAVDDHQLIFARRAYALGLVTAVEDVAELEVAIASQGSEAHTPRTRHSPLETVLRSYIEEAIGQPVREFAASPS